jgi:hypothetical protein
MLIKQLKMRALCVGAVIFIQADAISSSTESLPENVESQTRQATELLLNPTTMVSDLTSSRKTKGKEKGKELKLNSLLHG